MAHIWKDRVLETSTTTGTGNFTLAGAVSGFRAFSAVCATNDTVYYVITAVDASGVPTGDWETGLGTYSASNTLTRTTVLDSSNSGSAVNFSTGTKRVGLCSPAYRENRQTFSLVGSWDYSSGVSSFDITNIGYNQLLVHAIGLTTTSSGFVYALASVDNGSNFYSTSGNYKSINATNTQLTNQSQITGHTTSATAARSFRIDVANNLSGQKPMWLDQGNLTTYLDAAASQINAIRFATTAGNFSAGSVRVYGRD